MSVHLKGKDRHGVARWEVVIRYRIQGRRMRKAYITRGSKADAKSFEAQKKTTLETRIAATRKIVNPLFSNFCEADYWPHSKNHLKRSTLITRKTQLESLIRFFGDRTVSEIDAAAIDLYIERRLSARLQRISVNNELRVLRRVLTFARDERELIQKVPKVRFLSEDAKRVRVWTETEVQRLFTACSDGYPHLLRILEFLANTGARRGEALALTWQHVDFERRMVKVWPTSEDDEGGAAWSPKNRKPREIPLSDELAGSMATWRTGSNYVFPCPGTKKRYAYWPGRAFQLVQQQAALTGGVHTLRHTYASLFLQHVPDLFLLSKILGHSQTRVTELYSHLLPEHLARGRNAVVLTPAVVGLPKIAA